jgi:hypothetical protein
MRATLGESELNPQSSTEQARVIHEPGPGERTVVSLGVALLVGSFVVSVFQQEIGAGMALFGTGLAAGGAIAGIDKNR